MRMKCYIVLLIIYIVEGGDRNAWKSRTIYQLLTDRFYKGDGDTSACGDLRKYCGGTFKGIEDKLEYIKRMGFDAIWISPIPKNQGEDYHGYAFLDLFTINPHFGTPKELKSMVEAAHARDIWVMLDVVANHVAYIGTDYYKITPFDKAEYYHKECEIKQGDYWVNYWRMMHCRIFGLPDLDQDNSFVANTLRKWIEDTVTEYGFDGIRIDTVPFVNNEFWGDFAEASGVYQVGEVFYGDAQQVGTYAYPHGPLDGVLNYPLYFKLKDVYAYGASMYNLRTQLATNEQYLYPVYDGLFVDNHDNPRFLNMTKDWNMLQNALAFIFYQKGIPILYYGTEQGFYGGADPNNREVLWDHMDQGSVLYNWVKIAIRYRKQFRVWDERKIERYVDTNFYAFTAGKILICTTNAYKSTNYPITYHEFLDGQTLCNIFDTRDCVKVQDKTLTINMEGGRPRIYIVS